MSIGSYKNEWVCVRVYTYTSINDQVLDQLYFELLDGKV